MKAELIEKFTKLIDRFGEDGELYTFDFCTEYGLAFNNSTIDKIQFDEYDMKFYYNANTGDFDYAEEFDENTLENFYKDLTRSINFWRKDGDEEINEVIDELMRNVIPDAFDRSEFVDNIRPSVIEDLEETADEVFWHSGDVEISLARVLLDISKR